MKEPERQEIRDLMSEFLKNGGQIVEVPPYVNSENLEAYRPITQQEEMAVKLRCGLKANCNMTIVYRPQDRMWQATLGIFTLGFFPSLQSAEDAIRARAKIVFADSTKNGRKLQAMTEAQIDKMVSENV
jgi:hypothetical protein